MMGHVKHYIAIKLFEFEFELLHHSHSMLSIQYCFTHTYIYFLQQISHNWTDLSYTVKDDIRFLPRSILFDSIKAYDAQQLNHWLKYYCPQLPRVTMDLMINNYVLPSPQASYFDDIILIVTFNYAKYYDVIPLIELLYRRAFKNIIYCGRGLETPPFQVPFISIAKTYDGHHEGGALYECVNKLVDLNLDVQGFLTIGDDTLLYYWNLQNLSRNHVWVETPGYHIFDIKKKCWSDEGFAGHDKIFECDRNKAWSMWTYYYSNTKAAIYALAQTKHGVFRRCYSNLKFRNKGNYRINFKGTVGDAYYIPKRVSKEFSQVSRFMEMYSVYLEIVIPTVVQCIEGRENVILLPGKNIYPPQERKYLEDDPRRIFEIASPDNSVFQHPTKLYAVAEGNTKHRHFFCNHLLPLFWKH